MRIFPQEMILQSGIMWEMETLFSSSTTLTKTISSRTWHSWGRACPSFSHSLLTLWARQSILLSRATPSSLTINMIRLLRSGKLSWRVQRLRFREAWRLTEMEPMLPGAQNSTLGSLLRKTCQLLLVMKRTSRLCTQSRHATFWQGKLLFAGCAKSRLLRKVTGVDLRHLRVTWLTMSSLETSLAIQSLSIWLSTQERLFASTVSWERNALPQTQKVWPIAKQTALVSWSATP